MPSDNAMREETLAEISGTDSFAESLEGPLVRPGDEDYDQVRSVWNGMIDRRPAMIARCETVEDVINSVRFAKERGLPLSVRCGGHGVAGSAVCEGGLMIDLSPMNSVSVDTGRRIAVVQGGAKLGDLDKSTQAHGLATTAGIDPGTGVGGLTLGGGLGFLARKLGLTIDNLASAEVVLADGTLVTASAHENADLFWAIRGGGGNFGIVTAFEFKLHKVGPELMTAQIFYPFEAAREVLRFYREFMAEAPDELGCYALLVPVPASEPFPEHLHGKTALALAASHAGDPDEGRALLDRLAGIAEPILAAVGPMAYVELQSSFKDAAPDGGRYYWKSQYLDELTDELIDLVLERARALPGCYSNTFFEPMGGAINRVDEDATAFPHRNARFTIGISSGWTDPQEDEEAIAWTRDFHDAVAPHSTGGVYANYMDFDEDERVGSAYGANFDRLRQLKAKYDPDNLFRMNQNIRPSD
jgi:FAD/FMN-containing dehydrogenase